MDASVHFEAVGQVLVHGHCSHGKRFEHNHGDGKTAESEFFQMPGAISLWHFGDVVQ